MLANCSTVRPSLKGFEDLSPQLACLAYVIRQAHICHARVWPTRHGFELRDDVLQAKSFAGGLGAAGFELGVDDVDVEVVVGGLIYCFMLGHFRNEQ